MFLKHNWLIVICCKIPSLKNSRSVFNVEHMFKGWWYFFPVDDFVACYRDGWGHSVDITATQATVRINAWVLTPTNFAETSSFAFAKNSLITGTISLSQNIDLDSHLVILEVYYLTIFFIKSESNCNMFYKTFVSVYIP